MAKLRSNDGTDINFDGLTDSVTNLVGAIILLLVLIVAVTTNAVQETPVSPHAGESQAGQRPVTELLERIAVLQAQLDSANQQVHSVTQQVANIREQVSAADNSVTESEADR